jgi:uncharacterized protein (DUF2267 family)
MYYEGWRPGPRPARNRSKESFLQEVGEPFLRTRQPRVNAQWVAGAIFRFIDKKIAAGELADVRGQLPKALRTLWSEAQNRQTA